MKCNQCNIEMYIDTVEVTETKDVYINKCVKCGATERQEFEKVIEP